MKKKLRLVLPGRKPLVSLPSHDEGQYTLAYFIMIIDVVFIQFYFC